MAIKLYNTKTRQKEVFQPASPPAVTFYVCGPTVYDYIHVGNARVFIVFDVIRRYLEYRGYRVKMVQNYTDIDDKMIARAGEQGIAVAELARRFIEAYESDAAALRIRKPDVQPRATEHIPQIISLIKRLVEKGLAYRAAGDVYFDTAAYKPYGDLSGQDREELMAGARVEPGENKRHPLDFVLWKQQKPGEPAWDSPWGPGRPGWHIECSAMAMHYLGDTLDLHSGGSDLVFPHHENEAAQSTGATGKPFVRYWLHAGYLSIKQQKMSKSLGNVFTVREFIARYNPLDLRFFMLQAHYRSPLNFSEDLVIQAAAGRRRLQELVDNLFDVLGKAEDGDGEPADLLQNALDLARRRFEEHMDDDFNTADAIAVLFELARESNSYLKNAYPYSRELLERVLDFYRTANRILDVLDFDRPRLMDRDIEEAIARREEARRNKDWTTADSIRDELLSRGIILEDTPHGVRWKLKNHNK